MALLENLCTVLDQMKEDRYTLRQVVIRSQELDPPIDLDQKNIGTSMAALAHIGALKSSHIPGEGVAKHYERVLEGSFLEALKQGKFQGLYTKYRGATPTRPRRAQVEPEPEVEQQEPEFIVEEHDPEEIARALPVETFMAILAGHLEAARAESGPIREQLERVQAELRYESGMRQAEERTAQARVNDLNEQLRTARETIMNLQNDFAYVNARAKREPEPKILLQREGGQLHAREHGGSGGGKVGTITGGSHAMHKKPLTGHAPRVVVEYKKNK